MRKDIKKHPSPLYYFGLYLGAILIAFLGFVFSPIFYALAIGLVLLVELVRNAHSYHITDTGIHHEYKLLAYRKEFADYRKIQDLEVQQSFFGMIFGFGNVRINTAGSERDEIVFYGISNPNRYERIIRERLGMRI